MSPRLAPPPAPRYLPAAGARPASPEAESARHVATTFAAALAAARDDAPGSAETAIARVTAAVTDYATRCRIAGLPSQRTLVRLNDLTQRHAVVLEQQPRADELSAVVFRAFLAAYYGPPGVVPQPA